MLFLFKCAIIYKNFWVGEKRMRKAAKICAWIAGLACIGCIITFGTDWSFIIFCLLGAISCLLGMIFIALS